MKINAVGKVMSRTMKWIVNAKSLETVVFKMLAEFQRYFVEYSRVFCNIFEYLFSTRLNL